MEKINCVIVDDEPLSRKIISDYLKELDDFSTIEEFKSAMELRNFLENGKADVIFLDINMPLISGLDFLKTQNLDSLVVFITANPDHAIDAFEYNAFDYLLKPIPFDRFLKTIDKIKLYFDNHNKETETNKHVVIKENKRLYKLDINEILFIEAHGDYVKIHTEGKTYVTKDRLASYIGKLGSGIVQCHRSYIVNVEKVKYLEGNQAVIDEDRIPISAGYKEVFLSNFN